MTTLHPELEALMPEPAGFRTRHRSEPQMIGHYPWTWAGAERRRRKYDRPECEYEDLFTADQMREAIKGATERAAKQVPTSWLDAMLTGPDRVHGIDKADSRTIEALLHRIAAAIRGGDGGGR